MYDVRTGPAKDLHYTDEIIEQELLSTGDGFTTHFTGNLSWLPVRSTTIRITDGPNTVVDDGNGHLVGNVNAGGTNTINPNTGAYDVTFSSAPASGARIVVDYEYNSEANTTLPEIDLQLTMAPVTARTNKLRARWSQKIEAPRCCKAA